MSGLLPWENARAWGKMKRLEAENARLKAEVEKWKSWAVAEHAEKIVLKAEVKRLTAVIESHKDAGLRLLAMLDDERRKNAAKEGKQP